MPRGSAPLAEWLILDGSDSCRPGWRATAGRPKAFAILPEGEPFRLAFEGPLSLFMLVFVDSESGYDEFSWSPAVDTLIECPPLGPDRYRVRLVASWENGDSAEYTLAIMLPG